MSRSTQGWSAVYEATRAIPKGAVATYGQVASVAGMPGAARQVGWALHAIDPEDAVPWHRVINARGEISPRGEREIEDLQRALLEAEGVEFDPRGRIDLARFGWDARKSGARPARAAARSAKQSGAPGSEDSSRPASKTRPGPTGRSRKPGAKR